MNAIFSIKKGLKSLFLVAFICTIQVVFGQQNKIPNVGNVRYEMRNDGSFIVDIYYDVNDYDGESTNVNVLASDDNGATWEFAILLVSGDVGPEIPNGNNKHIVWNYGEEHPNTEVNNFRIKIVADDGIEGESYMPCPGFPTVEHGGKLYNTVQIYNQCWLKENLDIGAMVTAFSMKDDGLFEKFCYNNDPQNCNIYGGLYEWNEAMKYNTEVGSQGICPDGWRIPTRGEYVDGIMHNDGEFHGDFFVLGDTISSLYDSQNSLKSIGQGNGTNQSGFSLLLGGHAIGDGASFSNVEEIAEVWLSEESGASSAEKIYFQGSADFTVRTSSPKDYGLSVRCIKAVQSNNFNLAPIPAANTFPVAKAPNVLLPVNMTWNFSDPDNDNVYFDIYLGTSATPQLVASNYFKNSFTPTNLEKNTTYYWRVVSKDGNFATSSPIWSFTTDTSKVVNGAPCTGIPTVSYAGTTYNTVQIGDQCWLKENLNVGTQISTEMEPSDNGTAEKYCYNNEKANCDAYGGMYTWDEATQYSNEEGSQGLCPEGWHVPTNSEALALESEVDDNSNGLKAIGQGIGDGAGTNTLGFSALLGGKYWGSNYFSQLNEKFYMWTSTERNVNNGYFTSFSDDHSRITLGTNNKDYGMFIRCLKD